MKFEISAGGVIVKRVGDNFEILLLKDKAGKWTFPKGLQEKGELLAKTARREIAEEVCIKDIKLIKALTPVNYLYKWEGELVKKTVHYFLFEIKSRAHPKPQRAEGILDVQWFSNVSAQENIGYPKTNKPVLTEVLTELKN